MLKKAICLLSTVSLLGVLTACGAATNATAEVADNTPTVEAPLEEATTEAIAEPTSEPTSAPEAEEPKEEISEETEPVDEGLTVEIATEKLQKLCDAYNALYDSKGEAEELATRFLYDPDTEPITDSDVQTKDGYSLQNIAVDYERDYYTMRGILFGTLIDYYYDYVNKDKGYKSFATYISEHEKDELADMLLRKIDDAEKNGGIDTSSYCMNNVVWIPSIISNDAGKVSIENITDSISITYKDILMPDLSTATVAYQADIFIDGSDSGLKLVFDKDINLLNINDENADESVIKYVVPFE